MQDLISRCILAYQSIGLNAMALTSDMGSNNKAMWRELNVSVTRHERKTSFTYSLNTIHVIADVPHLLKNLRSATLSRPVILPQSICIREALVTRHVSTGCIKYLWEKETSGETSIRSLHHLTKEHLYPSQYQKMNVATAVQLFSKATAAPIEKEVHLRILNKQCLATAFWMRLIDDWFSIMTSRSLGTSITLNNREKKF